MLTFFFLRSESAFVLCAALALAGCSSKVDEPTSTGPTPKPPPAAPTSEVVDPNKLTLTECNKLFDHFLDVSVNDMMAKSTAGMSEAEKAKSSAPLRNALKSSADFTKRSAECQKEYSRDEYACMMLSTTERDFDACLSRKRPAAAPRGSQ